LITRPRDVEPLDPRLLTVIALPEAPKATRKSVIVSAASPGNPLRGEAFESRDENPKTGADTNALKSNQTAIRLATTADSKYLNLLNQGVSLGINHRLNIRLSVYLSKKLNRGSQKSSP